MRPSRQVVNKRPGTSEGDHSWSPKYITPQLKPRGRRGDGRSNALRIRKACRSLHTQRNSSAISEHRKRRPGMVALRGSEFKHRPIPVPHGTHQIINADRYKQRRHRSEQACKLTTKKGQSRTHRTGSQAHQNTKAHKRGLPAPIALPFPSPCSSPFSQSIKTALFTPH
jgi:hypothetical protein